jgi:hypothetical protein
LHNHCFLPKREAQKLVFAHFNHLKQNFRWRPQFTDQRQQISHLFCGSILLALRQDRVHGLVNCGSLLRQPKRTFHYGTRIPAALI